MDKELRVLREVRSLMETNWTRGINYLALVEREGRKVEGFCLVGGINKVTGSRMELNSLSTRGSKTRQKVVDMIQGKMPKGVTSIEDFNDYCGKDAVLDLLDSLIAELEEPKSMEIGTPEKEYTIEPAEPVPGIKESPAPTPEPRREPAKPDREKVPA